MFRMISKTKIALLIISFFAIAGLSRATTFYIAANGSDSNDGQTTSTPWLHAPGMGACTATCASYSPAAGDQFIFRGGDTWHIGNSSANPYVGSGQWSWKWGGSSSHCNYARTDTSTCIYVGVDQSYFSGSSWTRPVLNGDNPVTNGFPSSCQYDEGASGYYFLKLGSISYVTIDNFEFTGKCWSNTVGGGSQYHGYLSLGGGATNVMIENTYMHGWSATPSSADYHYNISPGNGATADMNQYAYIVIDGSDSSRALNASQSATYCKYIAQIGVSTASNLCASGQGIYGKAYDVHGSVFRYLGNFMVSTNTHTLHDNLFEYLYFTYSGVGGQQHPNIDNQVAQVSGQTTLFYNNILRHTYVTEDIYLAVTTNAYVFNNIFYDNMNVPNFGIIGSGCMRFNQVGNSNATTNAYIFNNTIGDGNCQFNFDHDNAPLTAWNGTAYFQNNHFIGFSKTALSSVYTCMTTATCNIVDNGNEVYQTVAAAAAQGYTASNNFAPTSSTGATVGAGGNVSNDCATFSDDNELCSGTSGGAAYVTGSGGMIAKYPAIPINPRPSSGAWDSGAYYLGGGTTVTKPNPPTGLNATVN
jgi:hypothetical protein